MDECGLQVGVLLHLLLYALLADLALLLQHLLQLQASLPKVPQLSSQLLPLDVSLKAFSSGCVEARLEHFALVALLGQLVFEAFDGFTVGGLALL